MKPIVIIGAGLSGLACACSLARAGKKVLVLEKKEKVGGRVYTQETPSGFLVDEGFQVLLSSYPELSHFVDLAELNLQPFNSGALIFNGNRLELLANPFRHPLKSFQTLRFSSASLQDKALVVKLMALVLLEKPNEELGSQTTLEFLKQFGFSHKFIDDFWTPFLMGVYLDPNLSVGAGFFKFLLSCFAWGEVTLPEKGMNQLPQAMANKLPADSIRLRTEVKTWNSNQVILESGEKIEASRVICAFDPFIANGAKDKHFRKATTFYFTSPLLTSLVWDKWLVLIPPHLGLSISHMALVSSVAQSYSKLGKPLLSATVVGENQSSELQVMKEVEKIAGKILQLELVAKTPVPYALPILNKETTGFEKKEGVWFCGDRFATPSINGALRSGRLTAERLFLE